MEEQKKKQEGVEWSELLANCLIVLQILYVDVWMESTGACRLPAERRQEPLQECEIAIIRTPLQTQTYRHQPGTAWSIQWEFKRQSQNMFLETYPAPTTTKQIFSWSSFVNIPLRNLNVLLMETTLSQITAHLGFKTTISYKSLKNKTRNTHCYFNISASKYLSNR